MLASCSDPTTDASPDAGSIDGLHACLDDCLLFLEPCHITADYCATYCVGDFSNAGPHCQDELGTLYGCTLSVHQAQAPFESCPVPFPPECGPEFRAHKDCVDQFGCSSYSACDNTSFTGPNGEPGCRCQQVCAFLHYVSECWDDGPKAVCNCFVGADFKGTCEGGSSLVCEEHVYRSCCNEFFKLLQ
jgi:hypothetical protein